MGGTIIETEADRIADEAEARGRREGEIKGVVNLSNAIRAVRNGYDTIEKLMQQGVSREVAIEALRLEIQDEQDGEIKGVANLSNAIRAVRNGYDTIEKLMQQGMSKEVAIEALRLG